MNRHRLNRLSLLALLMFALSIHLSHSSPGENLSDPDATQTKIIVDDKGFRDFSVRDQNDAYHVGQGDLYAVVVGVSLYKNPKLPTLMFSDKDAKDFAEFLSCQKELFRRIHVRLLINEQATRSAIEKELYYGLRKAGKDDTVIVFLSGIGSDDPHSPGEFFFLSYDADPEYLAASSVQMSRQWFLDKLDSQKVLLLSDSSQSGGFSGSGNKSITSGPQRFMKRFQESQGCVFMSSSRPDERSYELVRMRNGLFTYYLLEGLKGKADRNGDRIIGLQELYDYVYAMTKEASKDLQHPQMEGRIEGQFPLALVHSPQQQLPSPEPIDSGNAPPQPSPSSFPFMNQTATGANGA